MCFVLSFLSSKQISEKNEQRHFYFLNKDNYPKETKQERLLKAFLFQKKGKGNQQTIMLKAGNSR